MKILEIKELELPGIKVIKFARFCDHRGYFTEPYRKSQFNEDDMFMKGIDFCQANESYSKSGTIRGLHFQWNPFMGKLVRTVHGRMVDLFLDIRKGSPTFGKIAAYEMKSDHDMDYGEWIWVPPGFAHGNYFTKDSTIEYFCSGEYSPNCEAGISPFSKDIDWSLCSEQLKDEFMKLVSTTDLITDKDRNGLTLEQWNADKSSEELKFEDLK